jgi:hypothetical protein
MQPNINFLATYLAKNLPNDIHERDVILQTLLTLDLSRGCRQHIKTMATLLTAHQNAQLHLPLYPISSKQP